VFASAPGGRLVPLLPEHHIFRSETAHFDEKLAGCAALGAPIEQTAVSARPALATPGWWSYIFLAPLFDSPVLAPTTFWSIPLRVCDTLVVLCPHGSISFSGFLDETSET
jgi:hypothetical protein